MERYIVIAPHTKGDCTKTLRQIEAMGYITHFDWGCKDGEHCGWAVIEAESPAKALLVVPAFDRHNAKAVRLAKFSPQEVRSMHS